MRRQRHDPFLKRLYRAGTRDALTLFFPDLAARIDWGQWQWIDKEVLFRGRRRQAVIADLVGETRDVEGRYLLDFFDKSLHEITYWSVGLGELAAEEYAARDNPMGWALASWMQQQREGRVELRLRLVDKILRWVRAEEYRELLLDTLQTYYRLSSREQRQEEQLLRTGPYAEVEEMAQTVLGRMKAKERQEGRREGRQEGTVSALQRAGAPVLRSRFPDAPAELIGRIEHLHDPDRLEELIGRAATAASIEEIERLLFRE